MAGRSTQKQHRKRLGISSFKKDWRGERIGFLGGFRELILAILCGLMPWWFGSSNPPAVYVISLLVMVLCILTLVDSAVSGGRRGLSWLSILSALPVLGIALITGFGMIQWVEMGPEWLSRLSPMRFDFWKSWGGGESLAIPAETTTYRQAARLAWLDAEVYESVVWLGTLWALAVCVMRLPGQWGPIRRHGLVMAISALVMGVQSMLQAMTFTGKLLWIHQADIVISSAGPFYVHSHLASYLNMGLGFALSNMIFVRWEKSRELEQEEHMFLDERPGAGRGFLEIYMTGILMVSVLATRSRGGMLAMVVGICVFGLIMIRAARRMQKISMGANLWQWLIGFAVVLSIGLTMLTDVFAIFSQAKGLVGAAGGHAAGIRLQAWGLAWRTWRQAPFWGTGWGSYMWSTQPGFRPSVNFSSHAESDYVQVLTEGGIIGSVLVLATILAILWSVWRLVKRLEQPKHFGLVSGAVFGLVAVAWGSLTENNLRIAGVAVPAVVTLAHLVRLSKGWKKSEMNLRSDVVELTKEGFGNRFVGVLISLLMIIVVWNGLKQTEMMGQVWDVVRPVGLRHAGTDLVGWAPADLPEQLHDERRLALAKAEELAPGWGDYHIQRAIYELDSYQRQSKKALILAGLSEKEAVSRSQVLQIPVLLREFSEADRLSTRQQLLADPLVRNHLVVASESLAKAWQDHPSAALVHLEMASLSWLYDSGPSAAESLQRAVVLAGDRIDVLLRAGQVALVLGEPSIALEAFAHSLEVPEMTQELTISAIAPWASPDLVDKLTEKTPRVAVRAGESLISANDLIRRKQAGEQALGNLKTLGDTGDPETAYLMARAIWLTGDQEGALSKMKQALALKADDQEIRFRQVNWLIAAGHTSEALDQAKVMSFFWPQDQAVLNMINKAAEADAAGSSASSPAVKEGMR